MKKIFIVLFFISMLFSTHNLFSQSGWNNTFFNNTSAISKIVQRDSLNYFAFSFYGKYYYKSSDEGNSWSSFKEYSLDSILSIYDGIFLNPLTGWIVGFNVTSNQSRILKTTNGGNNWFEQNTGDNNYENRCLSFLNTNTGWVGGGGLDGKLYKTTNGGSNWIVQVFPNSWRLFAINFFDINNGWIMGENSFLARTTNGGVNWMQKTINNVQPAIYTFYRDLIPINNNVAYALVVRNAGLIYSHIYKTTNGGDNWDLTYSYTDSLSTDAKSMWSIEFQNLSTGYGIGGYSFFVKTTNSGINWNRINTYSDLGFNSGLNTMLFSGYTGIFGAGGNPGYSYIVKSVNSGLNWTMQSLNRNLKFLQITFADDNTGFAISDTDSGKVYRTTNSGNNWDLVNEYKNYWFKKITFANSLIGCAIISPNSYANSNSKILRTTNSGNNWYEIINPTNITAFTIQFIDQQIGFIGCDSNKLLYSLNAGLNWNMVRLSHSIPFDIEEISFINNSTGWLSGHHFRYLAPGVYIRNILWKTTNAGSNWNIVYDSVGSLSNYILQFVNENTGFKISNTGFNGYYKTTNGGANWFTVPLAIYPSSGTLKFINQNTGWISGTSSNNRVLLKTTNGGGDWIYQLNEYGGSVRSIYAIDENKAWFCGDYNSIYKTTNGGGVIGIEPINNFVPKTFSLFQNYPNPFNSSTIISYQLSAGCIVSIKIYDVAGKEIAVLVNQMQNAGYYKIIFDSSNLSSGIYFYTMKTKEFIQSKRMVHLK